MHRKLMTWLFNLLVLAVFATFALLAVAAISTAGDEDEAFLRQQKDRRQAVRSVREAPASPLRAAVP